MVNVEILQSFPVLQPLPKVTLENLARHSHLKELQKRQVVIEKGNSPSHFLLLLEGRLQGIDFTIDGKEVGTSFVNPTDFFGELGTVDDAPHAETVIALVKSKIVFIPNAMLRPLLLGTASMTEVLLMRLSKKLRELHEQRGILSLSNPLQKVCAQLTVLSRNSPSASVIPDMPTHQELAIMINASRETVTRVFQLLQGKGVVLRDGNHLRIQQITILRDIAEGQRDAP